jgi:acyl carrier protein
MKLDKKNIEDILSLTPMQEGMLFHYLKEPEVVIPGVDKSGNEYLCAYVTGTDAAPADKKLNTSELRAYLSRALPDYMIPSHFVQLEEIPLTPSGKLDRKALPALGKALSTGSKYIPPRNHIEKTIADIWKELLSLDKLGIHDHFFDIGGNSLLMIRLSSRLQEIFKRDLPVVTLFDYPTIDSLAGLLIRDKTGEPSINIDTGTRRADTVREKGKSRTDEIDKTNDRVRLEIAVNFFRILMYQTNQ